MQRKADTFEALDAFWDASRGHEGDPSHWSVSELQDFLDDPSWLDIPRVRLVQEVTRRLDDLYRTFSPSYTNVTSNINIAALTPWEPPQRRKPEVPLTLPLCTAGPLERCFNASFALHETMSSIQSRAALLMGRHPLDDLRQNQLLITKAYDEGKITSALLQDIEQTEAMALKVVGVRFLPPGRKLKAGDKVVCHNLHAHGGNMHNLNGLTASVVSAKAAAGTYTVTVDAAGDAPAGGSKTVVHLCAEVGIWRSWCLACWLHWAPEAALPVAEGGGRLRKRAKAAAAAAAAAAGRGQQQRQGVQQSNHHWGQHSCCNGVSCCAGWVLCEA
jgi:hypothetical protein